MGWKETVCACVCLVGGERESKVEQVMKGECKTMRQSVSVGGYGGCRVGSKRDRQAVRVCGAACVRLLSHCVC